MEAWRRRRNRWLVEHGFVDEHGWSDYSAYTSSEHWRRFRRTYFEQNEARCLVCRRGDVRLILHHLTYKRIGAELQADVTPLCVRCHDLVHDKPSTGRYIYKGALAELRRILLRDGDAALDELHRLYVDRRRRRARKRGRGRSQRGGRMLVKHASSMSVEERIHYGLVERGAVSRRG